MKKNIIFSLTLVIGLGTTAIILRQFSTPIEQQTPSQKNDNSHASEISSAPLLLVPQNISPGNGKSFTLRVAQGFTITPAFEGLDRVRFMAKSPDGRLFVTDMHELDDNTKGKIYILENFNATTKKFGKSTIYLSNLRNPNNVAFYTDTNNKTWLYVPLTDKLLRYSYVPGDTAPSTTPEVLATFPDYGLNYKYGGWHLTRTVAFHKNKLYVSVGSSCDLCEEKVTEPQRATILEMNPDGSEAHVYASGLRNAVGIKWIDNDLFATAMSPDHLGDDIPQDTFQLITNGANYGWPYCYEQNNRLQENNSINWTRKTIDCKDIPLSYTPLGAHSAPLGFDYFKNATDPAIRNYFLIALHGSGNSYIGRGYNIVRVHKGAPPEVMIDGFLQNGIRFGRPTDILADGSDSFFFTDDFGGVVYYVSK